MSRRLDEESKETNKQIREWEEQRWAKRHWPVLLFLTFAFVLLVIAAEGWL